MANSTRRLRVISIVATLYRSEQYIDEFVRRCSEAAQRLKQPYELILVDDGSPDRSLEVALASAATRPFLRVVELSRNFGHHAAMFCGLEQARGDLVFLLDADLEEDPAWLCDFHRVMGRDEVDVVFGVQENRRERGMVRILARLFYRLRRVLLDERMPQDVTTARLMSRDYVDALLQHTERTSPILDLWVRTGFRQLAHPVVKLRTSPTTYSLKARATLFFDTFIVGSGRLLFASSLAGFSVVAVAAVAGATLLLRWVAFDRPSPGWTSVMLTVLLMGGAILFTVSLIGMNLTRVAEEVRRRPRAIVRRVHGSGVIEDA
jgi:putative glycosyltransferase